PLLVFRAHHHERHGHVAALARPQVPIAELHHDVARLHHQRFGIEHEHALASQRNTIVDRFGLVHRRCMGALTAAHQHAVLAYARLVQRHVARVFDELVFRRRLSRLHDPQMSAGRWRLEMVGQRAVVAFARQRRRRLLVDPAVGHTRARILGARHDVGRGAVVEHARAPLRIVTGHDAADRPHLIGHARPTLIPMVRRLVAKRCHQFCAVSPFAASNDMTGNAMTGIRGYSLARSTALLALCSGALLPLVAGAMAQTFSSQPIRIIVGPSPDAVARVMGQHLQDTWGQPVVIEARTGAGGQIAATTVAGAEPDGHTLLFATPSYTLNTALKTASYDVLRDFAPAGLIGTGSYTLVVHPSLPAKSFGELVALARSQPGKLNCASAGIGTAPHIACEAFNRIPGVNVIHVPYRNVNEAMSGIVGNHVQIFVAVSLVARRQMDSGS